MTAAGKGAGLGGTGCWFCSLHGNRSDWVPRIDPRAGSGPRHVIYRNCYSPEELSLRHFLTWFLASGPLQLKSGDCGAFKIDGDCFSRGLAGGRFISKGMRLALALLDAIALFSSGLSGLGFLNRKHILRS